MEPKGPPDKSTPTTSLWRCLILSSVASAWTGTLMIVASSMEAARKKKGRDEALMVFFVIGKFGLLSIQICFIADLRTLKSKLIARERIKNHINMRFMRKSNHLIDRRDFSLAISFFAKERKNRTGQRSNAR